MPSKVARTSQRLLNSGWIKPLALLILTMVLWDVVKAFWTEGDKLLIVAVPTTLATLGGFFLSTLFGIPIAMLIAGSRMAESYVSSKACKGFYKSVLNVARVAASAQDKPGRFFMSVENLTCQARLSIQQDRALIAALGLAHAERNGHHYVAGFGRASEEVACFTDADPNFYRQHGGRISLTFEGEWLATSSLFAVPGFASGAEPDWGSLTPLPQ